MVTGSPSKKPDSPPAPIEPLPYMVGVKDNADLPNWFDGPVTLWAVVDRYGHLFPFGSERAAAELFARWEEKLPQFGPHRVIELVEKPRVA